MNNGVYKDKVGGGVTLSSPTSIDDKYRYICPALARRRFVSWAAGSLCTSPMASITRTVKAKHGDARSNSLQLQYPTAKGLSWFCACQWWRQGERERRKGGRKDLNWTNGRKKNLTFQPWNAFPVNGLFFAYFKQSFRKWPGWGKHQHWADAQHLSSGMKLLSEEGRILLNCWNSTAVFLLVKN